MTAVAYAVGFCLGLGVVALLSTTGAATAERLERLAKLQPRAVFTPVAFALLLAIGAIPFALGYLVQILAS